MTKLQRTFEQLQKLESLKLNIRNNVEVQKRNPRMLENQASAIERFTTEYKALSTTLRDYEEKLYAQEEHKKPSFMRRIASIFGPSKDERNLEKLRIHALENWESFENEIEHLLLPEFSLPEEDVVWHYNREYIQQLGVDEHIELAFVDDWTEIEEAMRSEYAELKEETESITATLLKLCDGVDPEKRMEQIEQEQEELRLDMKDAVDNLDKRDIAILSNKLNQFDMDGWEKLRATQEVVSSKESVSSFFPYEDYRGYFEDMNGTALIPWVEKMEFGEFEHKEFVSTYDVGDYKVDRNSEAFTNCVENRDKVFVEKMLVQTTGVYVLGNGKDLFEDVQLLPKSELIIEANLTNTCSLKSLEDTGKQIQAYLEDRSVSIEPKVRVFLNIDGKPILQNEVLTREDIAKLDDPAKSSNNFSLLQLAKDGLKSHMVQNGDIGDQVDKYSKLSKFEDHLTSAEQIVDEPLVLEESVVLV